MDRYLAREIVPPFFVAILAFLVFIGLELVISLSDTVVARGAGAAELLRLVSFKLPTLFTYAIPAAALLATFLALGRLAADRELLAFQAVGYSLRRLTVPFVAFGALASGVAFALGEYAVPSAEAAYRQELLALLYRGAVPQVQEAIFFRGLQGETYYVERTEGERLTGILVYDLTGRMYPVEGGFPTVITAEEGRFRGGTLELLAGRVLRFAADGALAEVVRFERLTVEAEEDLRQAVLGGKTPAEMSLHELGGRINLLRRSGLDPRSLVVEYHSKIAVSAAAFVFVLFGAPLGALLGRRGRAAGAIAGFLLAAAAQGLFVWARTLAQRGVIPPYLGAWLPHIGFGLLGLLLLVLLDRLRLRGLLPILVLLALGDLSGQAVPPFSSLEADELVLGREAGAIEGWGVRANFGNYALLAEVLRAREGATGWEVEAEGAVLTSAGVELHAVRLTAFLGPSGELEAIKAQGFRGLSTFQGPEKEEELLYSGEEGEVQFQEGEVARVEARRVRFTTCPCFPDAPYTVEAEEFVLVPGRWLYARSIVVTSFGLAVGWLPLYVARLGEEGFPLFPEIGWRGGELFLRWALPWTLGEGIAGAVGITWYPVAGRVDPSLRALWESGDVALTPTSLGLRFSGQGGGGEWRGTFSIGPAAHEVTLGGAWWGWEWALAWGEVEGEAVAYARLPELTLGRVEAGWLGGELALRASGGHFREGATAGWRVALTLSWTGQRRIGPFSLAFPWRLSFAHYALTERITASASPGLTWGPFTFSYQGRVGIGRSLFAFDLDPPQSKLALSFTAGLGGWQERLAGGWDFIASEPLPLVWNLSGFGLSANLSFTFPLAITGARWSLTVEWGPGRLVVGGGYQGGTGTWYDTVGKAFFGGETVTLFAAARLGMDPLLLARLAGSVEWRVTPEWSLFAAIEHDFRTGQLVQIEGSIVRSFLGCLRVGLTVNKSGILFSLDVPAFPQTKVRFDPLDEGLRLGG